MQKIVVSLKYSKIHIDLLINDYRLRSTIKSFNYYLTF